jgi:hypothetical protein
VTASVNDPSSKFKTPLLQSILSKTRINTILNKYADDPVISSSTLSLIAAQQQQSQTQQTAPAGKQADDFTPSENSALEKLANAIEPIKDLDQPEAETLMGQKYVEISELNGGGASSTSCSPTNSSPASPLSSHSSSSKLDHQQRPVSPNNTEISA